MTIGRGGATLHAGDGCTVSGFGREDCYVTCARILGLPIIDTTTIPEASIVAWAIRGPMPGCATSRFGTKPGEPYGSLDRVAIAEWAPLAASFGATVENVKLGAVPAASVRA